MNPSWSVVPPVFIGSKLSGPWSEVHAEVVVGDDLRAVAAAISTASPTWSPWPWVIRIWVAPSVASLAVALEGGVAGEEGVDQDDLAGKIEAEGEWPNQVIFIARMLLGGAIRGRDP